MKTTLDLKEGVLRRAKARAALRGEPLARFLEESVERRLEEEEAPSDSSAEWLESLPKVSSQASADLEAVLATSDFRTIDEDMWR